MKDAALCHDAMLASFPHRIRPAGIRGMAESSERSPDGGTRTRDRNGLYR
jgi:hypothetical protein